MSVRRLPVLMALAGMGALVLGVWLWLGTGPGTDAGAGDASHLAGGAGQAAAGGPRAGLPRSGSASGTGSTAGGAGVGGSTGAAGPGMAEAPLSEAEKEEQERATEQFRKLARDLEYTKGLKEPLQQVVQPSPEPWRRDTVREGPPPVIESISPSSGRRSGGEKVVLRGKNLRVVTVLFGANPARLLVAKDETVTVETPSGEPGPVHLAITNDDGTWTVTDATFTYHE